MNIYPAMQAKMGSWNYYVVRMTARELSESVNFAHEIYEDRTLSDAIQRVLREDRVNKEIVTYLKRQKHRFFSSLVIAAMEGDPRFYPVQITDEPQFAIFSDDRRLNEAFGVLVFDGTQTYYALDGQHRLAAIKTLTDRTNDLSDGAPEDFARDEFSVIIVVPRQEDSDDLFMRKYRRLFSNLNRYAKATDQATNIIMDEDDTIAILTRNLITNHPLFQASGRQRESIRIKTTKGKALKKGDSYFTSIETLYEMNKLLLNSYARQNSGWGPLGEDIRAFVRFRAEEDYIDELYEELLMYWNAIVDEIPFLYNDPTTMRTHDLADDEGDSEEDDDFLFWPIGQQTLAELVRIILDKRLPDPEEPDVPSVKNALKGLGDLEWRLYKAPWRYFLLIQDEKGRWKIRSEERKAVVRIARRMQLWALGVDELDEEGVEQLRQQWGSLLIPSQDEESQDRMWEEFEQIKEKVGV